VAAAQATRAAALAQIAHLEASQSRALREAILGHPAALEQLRKVDTQIAQLRSRLTT